MCIYVYMLFWKRKIKKNHNYIFCLSCGILADLYVGPSLHRWICTDCSLHTASRQCLSVPAGHTQHQVTRWSRRDTNQKCPWGGSYVSTMAVSGLRLLIWAELQTCTGITAEVQVLRAGGGGSTLPPRVVWHDSCSNRKWDYIWPHAKLKKPGITARTDVKHHENVGRYFCYTWSCLFKSATNDWSVVWDKLIKRP